MARNETWTIDRQEMIDALSDARVALIADDRPAESAEALADLILAQFWKPADPAAPGTGETLAAFVTAARTQRGLTLREAEKITGIANAHLSQIETGAIRRPGIAVLAGIAGGYGIPLRQLAQLAVSGAA